MKGPNTQKKLHFQKYSCTCGGSFTLNKICCKANVEMQKKNKNKFLQWPLEAGSESINRKVLTKDSSVKMPNSTSLNSIGVFVGVLCFGLKTLFGFPPFRYHFTSHSTGVCVVGSCGAFRWTNICNTFAVCYRPSQECAPVLMKDILVFYQSVTLH